MPRRSDCRPGPACGRGLALLLAAVAATVLVACSTPGRDGPAAQVPPGLDRVPDAEPRIEPLRSGGPNKPYEVAGRWYSPAASDIAWRETGLASWYGAKFHGRPTASGEVYDMHAMTAAHKTLPLPSYVRVRNPRNGREVVLRVNDRGPFVDGRVIDLSYTAALRLGVLGGVAPVEVVRITHDEIRAGLWRRSPSVGAAGALYGGPVAAPPPVEGPVLAADGDPLGAMLVDRGLAPPPATMPRR